MAPNTDRDPIFAPGPGCPINCAMEALGSRASILLLRQAFYGDRRFDSFVEHTSISEATVAKRLQELVDVGVLQKVPYQEPGARPRHEYELTPAGKELFPVILGLFLWGQRHLDNVELTIQPTGPNCEPLHITVQTTSGQSLTPDEINLDQKL